MGFKEADMEYLERAQALSREDAELIFSRMRGKLVHGLDRQKLPPLHAVALQLQYEDEQLAEWRQRIAELREREKEKEEKAKAKAKEKA